MLGRHAAELATSAVGDDTRQDENHADDTKEVSGVLKAEAVVPGVLADCQVNDHVERAGCHDYQQPDPAQGRDICRLEEPACRCLSLACASDTCWAEWRQVYRQ